MSKMLVSECALVRKNYEYKNREYESRDLDNVEFKLSCGITESEIIEFIDFIENNHKFSLLDIRYRALFLALKYGFSIDSFWKHIQKRRKIWK